MSLTPRSAATRSSPVAIKDTVRPDGAPARTDFTVLSRFTREGRPFTLLQLNPLTGRKHQLRIHLAHYGHPIVGDKIYGGDPMIYLAFVEGRLTDEHRQKLLLPNHALHAREVRLRWRERDWRFTAPPDEAFTAFHSPKLS